MDLPNWDWLKSDVKEVDILTASLAYISKDRKKYARGVFLYGKV